MAASPSIHNPNSEGTNKTTTNITTTDAPMSLAKLFRPLKLGPNTQLSHRLVMAPLTRFRANPNHTPSPLAKQYYEQRASTPGTLLITEATFISPRAGGYAHVPGIWTSAQIAAWREIVAAVHRRGGVVFMQLWALGRVAREEILRTGPGGPYEVVSASAIPARAERGARPVVPRELREGEIRVYIREFAEAARKAMEAGFDGVELHGANGYLIDQFWQDGSNQRTDGWGGSVEKRARFGLEVTKAVIEAVGDSRRVAVRLSPFGTFQSMGMEDPVPQFDYIIRELRKWNLAYLHLIESRESGSAADGAYHDQGTKELKGFIDAWGPENPLILAGGFTPEKASWAINEFATGDNIAIAFGRYFISTPDLPYRVKHGLPLNKWDRSTFYTPGAEGYVDYEFSNEWIAEHSKDSRL